MKRRVVITGMGALTPIGNNMETYWLNLLAGTSGANLISRFDASGFKTRFACEVKGFDPLDFFDRKEARKLDRFHQYGLVTAGQAIRDAGLEEFDLNRERAGVIWSSGIGGFESFEQELENYFGSPEPRFNPFFITRIIANGLAGYISIRHGFQGINSCPVTACASSTQALIQAFNYIRWGKAEVIIAGGSEAPVTRSAIGGFNAMKSLSVNNDNYLYACRPFDSSRDGFVLGEGSAGLVLEEMEHALRRGAHIYAEILGGGERADAYHITGTHPEGEGAYLAMKEAIREAGLQPAEIDYVNAHATSTGVGDISEAVAIARLFGHSAEGNLHVSANKSMTGHLLGAAGAVEAVATVLSVYHDQIPPTINTKTTDPEISPGLDFCLQNKVTKKVRYALSNNFGFGGHCAAVVIGKYGLHQVTR